MNFAWSSKMRRLILVIGYGLLVISIMIPSVSGMDVDLWNLPTLTESETVWADKPLQVNGIIAPTTHLRSRLSAKEIINFYKDFFIKADWQVKEYYPDENAAVFTKEDKFFYVAVLENVKESPCDVYLVSSQRDLEVCKDIKDYFLQKEIADDTPGKDFSDIPRYPASKRRLNVFSPFEGAVLIYEAQAQPKEIAQFYRSQLKLSGWREERALGQRVVEKAVGALAPQLKDGIAILCFYRGNDSLLINITRVDKDYTSTEKLIQRSLIIITKNVEQELSSPEGGK